MSTNKLTVKIHFFYQLYKNKAVRYLKNYAFSRKFVFLHNQFGIYNGSEREKKIIISLTSFPTRMDKIHYALKSLLLQKVKPDKIVIYLGDKEFADVPLPDKVKELEKYGVEFRFCKDLKPHTKYFYAVQEFPNDIVITVDDDILYSASLIKDLMKAHTNNPDMVICTRAHKMIYSEDVLLPYNSWDFETKDIKEPSHYLFATGVGGVLYPPHCLPAETFNEQKIEELSLRQDDVWLKAMEIMNGTKVLAIPASTNQYMIEIVGSQGEALNKTNVHENRNDAFLHNVFGYYNISKTMLDK